MSEYDRLMAEAQRHAAKAARWWRIALIFTVIAAVCWVVVIVSVVANAAEVSGTSRDDRLRGTDRADVIRALAGDDRIRPRAGTDYIYCGAGFDVVLVDDLRDVYRNCERVRYSPP